MNLLPDVRLSDVSLTSISLVSLSVNIFFTFFMSELSLLSIINDRRFF